MSVIVTGMAWGIAPKFRVIKNARFHVQFDWPNLAGGSKLKNDQN